MDTEPPSIKNLLQAKMNEFQNQIGITSSHSGGWKLFAYGSPHDGIQQYEAAINLKKEYLFIPKQLAISKDKVQFRVIGIGYATLSKRRRLALFIDQERVPIRAVEIGTMIPIPAFSQLSDDELRSLQAKFAEPVKQELVKQEVPQVDRKTSMQIEKLKTQQKELKRKYDQITDERDDLLLQFHETSRELKKTKKEEKKLHTELETQKRDLERQKEEKQFRQEASQPQCQVQLTMTNINAPVLSSFTSEHSLSLQLPHVNSSNM